MAEGEPKNPESLRQPQDVTEQFFSMRFSEFRDYLDNLWKQDPTTKIAIILPERYMVTRQVEDFLRTASKDSRVLIVKK